jgi:alanine-synthesizing transaminase
MTERGSVPPFSSRVPSLRDPNAFMEGAASRQAGDASFVDLTETNPTRVGLTIAGLTPAAWSEVYDPDPRGLGPGREAIAEYYRDAGSPTRSDDILLTASTSEAYAFLFKLLADPGDEVLVPAPSYPLFEHLTRLEGVRPCSYALRYGSGRRWGIDFDSMRRELHASTRAIVLVHPNNPTGSYLSAAEIQGIGSLASEHAVPLIADEVFFDYLRPDLKVAPNRVTSSGPHLTFSLGGLSKLCALPQAKLAWIRVDGPPDLKAHALDRLAFIADAYLSVGSAIQAALPSALARRHAIQARIRERLDRNTETLEEVLRVSGVGIRPREGGWYAVLELPAPWTDDAFASALLEDGVLVHPGYFYDFEEENLLVTSLLTEEPTWHQGLERLAARAARPS